MQKEIFVFNVFVFVFNIFVLNVFNLYKEEYLTGFALFQECR